MVKKKVSVEVIVKAIEAASAVKFDVSTDEIKLHEAGADDRITLAMLERVKAEHVITPDIQINDDGVIDIKQKPQQSENQAVPSTSNSKKPTVRKKSFTFELDACKTSGEVVVCEVLITNNDKEPRKLQFGYDARWSGVSRIVDDQGKEYKASRSTLSDKGLYQDVPVRATIVFDGIENQSKSIKLLVLSFHAPPADARIYSTPASRLISKCNFVTFL